jgi:hypothetical protein
MNKRKNGMFQWRKWGKYFVLRVNFLNFMLSDVNPNLHDSQLSFFNHYISAASGFTHSWVRVTSLFPAGGFSISAIYSFIYKTATL